VLTSLVHSKHTVLTNDFCLYETTILFAIHVIDNMPVGATILVVFMNIVKVIK
jgi:hypothetical protein